MALRKDTNGRRPEIEDVTPVAAIPGGEFQIHGKNFTRVERGAVAMPERPRVLFGDVAAPVIIGSNSFLIARVPEGASQGELVVQNGERASAARPCGIGVQIADGLQPVANPAVDDVGNIFATLSGPRGQKTPVSVYKIDLNYNVRPFLSDILNATAMCFDREGMLYISSRHEGIIYQASPNGNVSQYVEGMGVATGLAFDEDENLYVGDRSGTIFKISRSRQIYVFCTLEPSIAAYHLAFGIDRHLYVSGPTTSSFDAVYRITPAGDTELFYRGLGRPQGIAFDVEGRLYIAASLAGRKGIVRITDDRQAELFLSGPNIVGVAFAPSKSLIVATNSALYRVDVGIKGKPLP